MKKHLTPLEKGWEDFKAFCEKWRLEKEEVALIFDISPEVYDSWVESGAISFEPRIIFRCALLYGLHEALLVHFSEDDAYAWVRRPNTGILFGGRTAIQTICEEIGKNPKIIQEITSYLKAEPA
jgi:hypothetical protein